MAKNFLVVSPSFVEEMKETKAKIDRMAVFAEIFLILDDKYEINLPQAEILIILEKKGFNYSISVIRNFLKIIRETREFLFDKSENKIADFVNYFNETATRSGYTRFVNIGISCFIADKITSWEQVEKLMSGKNDEVVDIPSFEIKPDVEKNLAEECVDRVSDLFKSLIDEYDLLKNENDSMHKSISFYENGFKKLQSEHCECLDELKDLKSVEEINIGLIEEMEKFKLEIAGLKKEKSQDNKTIEFLKETKQQLDSEITRLKQEIEELKKTDIQKVYSMITNLTEKGLERGGQAKIIGNGKEKFQNSDLLPKKYIPEGNDIVYSKLFIAQFNDLDRTVAKNISKTIRLISENGLNVISASNKKVIQKCVTGVPDKSIQVTIKKYRTMCRVFAHVLYFYDVFHRKNSPYAS